MAAVIMLALVGGGVLLALLTLSFRRAGGPARASSTRAEATEAWRSRDGGTTKRKVLLIGRANKDRRTDEGLLRAAGYDVRSCAGPEGSRETFPYGGCLLL